MYQVYSQQRPGRPRWTLGASAVVLLLTMALAAAMTHFKTRALLVQMNEPQFFASGRLNCSIPSGWNLLPESDLQLAGGQARVGLVFVAREPARKNHAGRRLFVFRDSPRPLGTPLLDGVASLHQKLSDLTLVDSPRDMKGTGADRIGSLPGCSVISAKRVANGMIFCSSRVALAPDGAVVAIVLALPETPDARDAKLVDQISQSLTLVDGPPAKDPAALMQAAGISFDMPAGARLFDDPLPGTGCIQMTAGMGDECWFLTAYRLPLLSGRTPDALLRDFCRSTLEQPQIPQEIENSKIGQRTTTQIHFALGPKLSNSIFLLCAQTDSQTALMLVGRHESEGFEALRQTARSIADSAVVAPYSTRIDLDKARGTGADWLSAVGKRGLHSFWGNYDVLRANFTVGSPSMHLGDESRVLTAARKPKLVWSLSVDSLFPRRPLQSREVWRLSDDGRAHDYASTASVDGTKTRYSEKWSGGKQVHRELEVEGYDAEVLDTDVDDLYVSEPLLILAAATLSGEKGAPALFSSTQLFTTGLSYWIVKPMGLQPVPEKPGTTAPAALLQRDYDPLPIMLYFEKDHSLLAVQAMGGRYQIRTRQSAREGAAE